jgi:hypothetical protein
MLFASNRGDRPGLAEAKRLFHDGHLALAVQALPSNMQAERDVLRHLQVRSNPLCAFH